MFECLLLWCVIKLKHHLCGSTGAKRALWKSLRAWQACSLSSAAIRLQPSPSTTAWCTHQHMPPRIRSIRSSTTSTSSRSPARRRTRWLSRSCERRSSSCRATIVTYSSRTTQPASYMPYRWERCAARSWVSTPFNNSGEVQIALRREIPEINAHWNKDVARSIKSSFRAAYLKVSSLYAVFAFSWRSRPALENYKCSPQESLVSSITVLQWNKFFNQPYLCIAQTRT